MSLVSSVPCSSTTGSDGAYSNVERADEPRIEATVDLGCVATEDHVLVKDVCAVLVSMRPDIRFESISITTINNVYHITASFPAATVAEIYKTDLDVIIDVNPLRVSGVSVVHDNTRLSIKVKVCGFAHPITCTDTQLVRVVKRKRWTLF